MIAAARVNRASQVTVSSPPKRLILEPILLNTEVNTLGALPHIMRAAFCRKYDTPIAVMRTARDPVPLKGLYASPSIRIPRVVQTIIARITDTHAGKLR